MMELYLNATSPYARVVRILLMEKGLTNNVTLTWCDPWADDPALLQANPAGRIPALVTDTGVALSESLLIAMHLEGAYPDKPLLPANALAEVLHLAGLGQNLMEAAFNTVIGRKHGGREVDNSVLGERRSRAIQRLLQHLEATVGVAPPASTAHLGDITIAVALDYLTFRLPEMTWQAQYRRLEAWHAEVVARPSFKATAFS